MSKTERYKQGNDRIDSYTDADFFAAGYDPLLLEILPRTYLAGRLDAIKGKCKSNEHWVNRGKGFCRKNPGSSRGQRSLKMPAPDSRKSESKKFVGAAIGGAAAGVGVGAIAGAAAMSAIAFGRRGKAEAQEIGTQAKKTAKEAKKTRQKVEEVTNPSGGNNPPSGGGTSPRPGGGNPPNNPSSGGGTSSRPGGGNPSTEEARKSYEQAEEEAQSAKREADDYRSRSDKSSEEAKNQTDEAERHRQRYEEATKFAEEAEKKASSGGPDEKPRGFGKTREPAPVGGAKGGGGKSLNPQAKAEITKYKGEAKKALTKYQKASDKAKEKTDEAKKYKKMAQSAERRYVKLAKRAEYQRTKFESLVAQQKETIKGFKKEKGALARQIEKLGRKGERDRSKFEGKIEKQKGAIGEVRKALSSVKRDRGKVIRDATKAAEKYEAEIAKQSEQVEALTRTLQEKEIQISSGEKLLEQERARVGKMSQERAKERRSLQTEEIGRFNKLKELAGYEHDAGYDKIPDSGELIEMAKKRLADTRKEAERTRGELEKATAEVDELKNALLTFPIPRPGGYVKDPRTNRRPVESDNRNRDRGTTDPADVDWSDPAQRSRYNKRVAASIKNAEEWRNQVFSSTPSEPPKGVGGKVRQFLSDPDNQSALTARASATVGGSLGGAFFGPPGSVLGSLLGGGLGRALKSNGAFQSARARAVEAGETETVELLDSLKKAGIRNKKDLQNNYKMQKFKEVLARDATLNLEARGVDALMQSIMDLL